MYTSDDPLFQSSIAMTEAAEYSDWTFSLFRQYVRGDVLEVGCGIGTFTRLLARSGLCQRLVSIDVVPEAVAECRSRVADMNVDIRLADVMSISDMFDCIVCMNVLEHIRDDHDALTHMLSRLNSGGTLFLLVPAHQGLFTAFDVAAGHYRRYNKESMAALIAAIGSHDFSLRQYYFNAIGAIGYYIVYGLLRKPPKANASAEIGLFDRYVVPVQRVIEPRWMPFGISLITVIRRQPVDGR